MSSRRDAIKTLAVAAAVPVVSAQVSSPHRHDAAEPLVQVKTESKPKFFTTEEFALLEVLTEMMIPRSDTPGAVDAGVPMLIDDTVSRRPAVQKLWRDGLAWVAGKSFGTATHDQQAAMMTEWSDAAGDSEAKQFFKLLKDWTIDHYYSTREGLVTELGWHGNTFLTEFKGCTHPEHQTPHAD